MQDSGFLEKVGLELKRAERYSVFVSLVVLDLSFLTTYFGPEASGLIRRLHRTARVNVREIDSVSVVDGDKLVLLLPETPRQGAEIAGRRVSEVLQDELSRSGEELDDRIIPLEMASYPDAAGARTIADFLATYSHKHRN